MWDAFANKAATKNEALETRMISVKTRPKNVIVSPQRRDATRGKHKPARPPDGAGCVQCRAEPFGPLGIEYSSVKSALSTKSSFLSRMFQPAQSTGSGWKEKWGGFFRFCEPGRMPHSCRNSLATPSALRIGKTPSSRTGALVKTERFSTVEPSWSGALRCSP